MWEKWMVKVFFGVLLLLLNNIVLAEPPVLVLDMPNEPILPHHFRTTEQPLSQGASVNNKGLKGLEIAGSAQFSEQALQEIIKQFPAPFTIVDLRQESHGFLNGDAISWFNEKDDANKGKTEQQVLEDETKRLNELRKQSTVNVLAGIKQQGPKTLHLSNNRIQSEKQLVSQFGLRYERLVVTDHYAPSVATVDRFIQLTKTLRPNSRILFHCRGGAGRTTTFMVMYDMMRNAKQVEFDAIILRHHLLGGHYLLQLPSSKNYKYLLAKQRINFLKKFYEYCRVNHDNYKTTWGQWLHKHKRVK